MQSIKLGKNHLDMNYISNSWGESKDQPGQDTKDISIVISSEQKFQEIEGVGAAFSEIGGKALFSLEKKRREEIMKSLFDNEEGAGFTYCRLPIGASDFGLNAYSLNDNVGDYEMEKFSLHRDMKYLIPYIKLAQKYASQLKIHTSPWSPPAWLKDNNSMINGGSLIDSVEVYNAYALYFSKFLEEYAKKGIDIDRLMIQNEPDVNTKYPSCVMSEEQMSHFIRNYLIPMFERRNINTKICAGTFRTVTGLQANKCMGNTELMDDIDGIGVQYSIISHLNDIFKIRQDKKIIHTESVCYDGQNKWEQAVKLYNDFVNYINAGCSVYTYWNMILDHSGKSTWGWCQNSLISINDETGEVTYNPDFYVMKLIGSYLRPGARRIESFCFDKCAIAFENIDKSIVVFVSNMNDKREVGTIILDGKKKSIELPPQSINGFKF
ncbi:glycoside hydrolase family 30 protein [Clostridium grantii]|uniref:Glucosylceramidase n=1 Tax=Clostridium grantii DSM 8605 TaxID=1121316 RepID=A0A1M5T4V0_9CLOT|nr:glycoside hydrolase family 30 beta sandwich domain-containing protein [Clostridium grantii]SHH45791.1 glucosylceramidase [Clostridium grantii DSM 8605]